MFAVFSITLVLSCITKPEEPSIRWEKTFGSSEDDRGFSVQQTTEGGYVVAGYTSSGLVGTVDVYLLKIGPWNQVIFLNTQVYFLKLDGKYVVKVV